MKTDFESWKEAVTTDLSMDFSHQRSMVCRNETAPIGLSSTPICIIPLMLSTSASKLICKIRKKYRGLAYTYIQQHKYSQTEPDRR